MNRLDAGLPGIHAQPRHQRRQGQRRRRLVRGHAGEFDRRDQPAVDIREHPLRDILAPHVEDQRLVAVEIEREQGIVVVRDRERM